MKKNGIIKRLMFTLCLGHNGGYLQFGGYSKKGFTEEPRWFKLAHKQDFKIGVNRILLGDKPISGYQIGFVDSGTSFAYFPKALYTTIKTFMASYCNKQKSRCGRSQYHKKNGRCFPFRYSWYPNGPQEFFDTFPPFIFEMRDTRGEMYEYTWRPSEYLYKDGNRNEYCFAFYEQNDNYIMMGGTFMRQHGYIFDVENERIGIARASCGGKPYSPAYYSRSKTWPVANEK